MKKIHSLKSYDYGFQDPLANLRLCENCGIPAWVGVIVRLSDKLARLYSFCKKKKLKNESVRDTFLDIANYAILGLILYEESIQKDNTRSSRNTTKNI